MNRKIFKAIKILALLVLVIIASLNAFPANHIPEREIQDLRPRQGFRIIDAAFRIPNMNDGFYGTAPDCGAYEAGHELPCYGPRKLN